MGPFPYFIFLASSGTLLGGAVAMQFRHKPGARVCPARILFAKNVCRFRLCIIFLYRSLYIFYLISENILWDDCELL